MNSEPNRFLSYDPPVDSSSPPVVLIVEDNRDLADLYTAYLEDRYTVRTAYSGDEALELLDDDVDVALLDRRLDEWRGDEFVTVIHDRQVECQIALVSAVTPDFDIVDLAIDGYLPKPVSRDELRQTVDELLQWANHDPTKQELLALISRRMALENEKTSLELDSSPEYAKLKRRIQLATERLGLEVRDFTNLSSKYRPDACYNCGLRWDVSVRNTIGFGRLGAQVWVCLRCGNVDDDPDPSDRNIARR